MSVGYGIVTTKGREDYLEETLNSISENGIEIKVLKDLQEGQLKNHIASMIQLFADNDWAFLIQDDVIASKNWSKLVELMAEKDYPIVSFYSATKQTLEPTNQIKGYYLTTNWINEQAMLIRKDFYYNFLDWVFAGLQENPHYGHDGLLQEFLKKYKFKVKILAPSIFQHTGEKSSVGHAWKMFGKERNSPSFMGKDWDCYEHYKNLYGI